MKALLDTNAISEYSKPIRNRGLEDELARIGQENLYLSVISLGEIDLGLRILPAGKRQVDLITWATAMESRFKSRILPVDRQTTQLWVDVSLRRRRIGRPVSTNDALIAATAIQYNLTLVTRNTADFADTGATVLNPWT